jgi:hypothetical protein
VESRPRFLSPATAKFIGDKGDKLDPAKLFEIHITLFAQDIELLHSAYCTDKRNFEDAQKSRKDAQTYCEEEAEHHITQ